MSQNRMTFRAAWRAVASAAVASAAVAVAPLVPAAACTSASAADPPGPARPPNVIYILADDLGYGELGCYGQEKIRTPHLDRLAANGMRFTRHYSGSPVCAPSRCTLLTGLHTGHAYVRDNKEMGGWGPDEPEGQLPLPAGTVTLATRLRDAGYATAAIGKWGLGGPASTGHPNRQGFDLFYGYLCQRVAHNYYPTHLWRNEEKVPLDGNAWFSAHQRLKAAPESADDFDRYHGRQYAPDLMIEEALRFVRAHRGRPFFLYFATPVPHAALQVPEDSLRPYLDEGWDDGPYLGRQGYLPHAAPRAAYAAMVTRFDAHVGRLLALVEELGLADDTIVMCSSDNGPTFNGGTDSAFFESTAGLRGLKCSVYEGGVRVPLIVRWPGRVAAGTTSDHVSAFWDVLPTVCDLAGIDAPPGLDGISFAPTLLGRASSQREHDHLYWEYAGHQALLHGRWKAVQRRQQTALELYDLDADPAETTDVAATHPEVATEMAGLMRSARTDSAEFPLRRGD